MSGFTGDETTEPISRDQTLTGWNGDREKILVQLTTSMIDSNLATGRIEIS